MIMEIELINGMKIDAEMNCKFEIVVADIIKQGFIYDPHTQVAYPTTVIFSYRVK